jgi:sugar phosphate permease
VLHIPTLYVCCGNTHAYNVNNFIVFNLTVTLLNGNFKCIDSVPCDRMISVWWSKDEL